jgi:hypothetical protein
VDSPSSTQIALALAAGVTFVGYAYFILVPAWGSYGRMWERFAASVLTLFILATLVGAGAGIGFSIVWFYDRFA